MSFNLQSLVKEKDRKIQNAHLAIIKRVKKELTGKKILIKDRDGKKETIIVLEILPPCHGIGDATGNIFDVRGSDGLVRDVWDKGEEIEILS